MENNKPQLSKLVPGPKNKWLVDLYFKFIKAPFAFFLEVAKAFPKISRFRFFHMQVYLVSEPDYIKHILQTKNRIYQKGKDQKPIKAIVGQGLFTAEGDEWRQRRKQLQPHFYKKTIENYFDIMLQQTEASLAELLEKDQGLPIDIYKLLSKLTLQVISQSLFDYKVKKDFDETIATILNYTYDRITLSVPPLWVPVTRNREYKKHLKILSQVIDDIWNQEPKENQLFLSTLKDGSFTTKEAKDEIITMFIAGHETTSMALTFAIYLLAKHPEKEALLRKELETVLGGRKPEVEDLKLLKYTQQIILEAMRLYPPAWGTSRTPTVDDDIDGYKIKKGSIVNICPYAMHHHPKLWEDPDTFKPERFEEEPIKFSYLPFGSGPRKCIGEHFAMMEMTIVLALFYQQLSFKLVDEKPIELVSKITLRPKEKVLVTFELVNY